MCPPGGRPLRSVVPMGNQQAAMCNQMIQRSAADLAHRSVASARMDLGFERHASAHQRDQAIDIGGRVQRGQRVDLAAVEQARAMSAKRSGLIVSQLIVSRVTPARTRDAGSRYRVWEAPSWTNERIIARIGGKQ